MKTKFVVYVKVSTVEQRVARKHVRGVGKDAEFSEHSQGWYVKFADWPASIFLGNENPGFEAGDKIKMTLEKQ